MIWLLLVFVPRALRITVPYAMAALGGTLSERAGVIALALEGEMIAGAFCATLAAWYTGSAAAGAAAGVAGGAALAALYGVVVLRFRAEQIVPGVAINLLALGLSGYLLSIPFDSTANSERTAGVGDGLVDNPLFWVAAAAVPLVWLAMARTRFGLRLRAVGEHPEAAATRGISVARVRWSAVLLCGALAGLGGAWLSLGNHRFATEMTGGRGYIALAAVIMGRWHPLLASLACLLFGTAEALQVELQNHAIGVPQELLDTLPAVLTIVTLAGFVGRSRPPGGLGKPWP
ncbi:MAG TPA: ABC transporter permease [Kofleriaceae bacterium]|nr:ABC transporter permease [Kofleriaceae bacterium]